MDLLAKEHISGANKHDWKLFIKLALSGIFTALGIYDLGYNLELAFATLIFIPAGGMFFTYLKHEADSNILRWVSILVFAAIFGLLIDSLYMAFAMFLIMEGATHSASLVRYDDSKWMKVVRAEGSADDLNKLVAGHTLFHSLPEDARMHMAEKSTVMEVEPGVALIKQGEFNYYLFLLAKGEADVVRDGEFVATIQAGHIFGEVSAAGLSLPVADVVAKDNVLAFAFPIDLISEMAESNDAFAEQLREMGMELVTKHDKKEKPEG
ncbi:cyclic nucleotide-binding domain protein [Mariprofundus micogutta]|uniref:Cyclic nucleotide-binding domain protein n=1 Tax=Mariprofundus micogutta TaxID=1921010 RepID=A0A1L8CKE1_9PROT|nr:cyclic nucleotide-binding domain-containing protein [Mariprofundus micogutta]GAV19388.1 cyclic nucleotide-binding domain protein [Mariprofundus micogutta]